MNLWKRISILVAIGSLVASGLMLNYVLKPFAPVSDCSIELTGELSEAMLFYVRNIVRQSGDCAFLNVEIFSPGGSVALAVEISQELRRAKTSGLIVRTVGRSFVASGATLLLSAGSLGHRYISENSLVLVHGIQTQTSVFGPMKCVDRDLESTSEDGKLLNQAILLVAVEYSINTGKPLAKTLGWLARDNSQVGNGKLAIKLGLADKLSK